jgi:NAD(P)-dependent dehydrogenase (short-subunit alcohol dehydrogenase family)
MAGRLTGKVALISGGASGIGAAHVRVFAAEGAKVVAGDLQEDKGQAVVGAVNKSGGEAIFVRIVCHWRLVRQCKRNTRAASCPWHPKIQILVCFPYSLDLRNLSGPTPA